MYVCMVKYVEVVHSSGLYVTVYSQDQNHQPCRSSLSVVTQADTLWVGITTHTSGHMHVSFLPKEYDITKALHSDVMVMWAAEYYAQY